MGVSTGIAGLGFSRSFNLFDSSNNISVRFMYFGHLIFVLVVFLLMQNLVFVNIFLHPKHYADQMFEKA